MCYNCEQRKISRILYENVEAISYAWLNETCWGYISLSAREATENYDKLNPVEY